MTRAQIRRRYVRTVKMGEAWNTYLQIDHQGFCVVEQTTKERARWYGRQLAIALERLVLTETDQHRLNAPLLRLAKNR